MDHWIGSYIIQRREELHAEAAAARLLRLLESARSSNIRGQIADGADILSFWLAKCARKLRAS